MNRDRLHLQRILDAIAQIQKYSAVGRDEFLAERHWQDAVFCQLIVLGEAVKCISPTLRGKHPEVPWRGPAQLRDFVAHAYWNIDPEVIWSAVINDLPALKSAIGTILKDLPSHE